MRNAISTIIILSWTLLLITCTNQSTTNNELPARPDNFVYEHNIGDSSAFRMAIVKSIEIPFDKNFDTLIVESQWRICGETPDDFEANYPEPNIDKHPFADTLAKLLNLDVISNKTFDSYMKFVLETKFNGNYPESLYETCLADNIHLNVLAKRLKDNSFLVITNYSTADTSVHIDNIFIRNQNSWTVKRVGPGPIDR